MSGSATNAQISTARLEAVNIVMIAAEIANDAHDARVTDKKSATIAAPRTTPSTTTNPLVVRATMVVGDDSTTRLLLVCKFFE